MIYNTKVIEYADSVQIRIYEQAITSFYKLPTDNDNENKNNPIEKSENNVVSDEDFEKILEDLEQRKKKECDDIYAFQKIIELEELEKEQKKERTKRNSISRTINQIYSLARSNTWEYFITLTYNQKLINNDDYNIALKKIQIWVNNIKKKYAPNLKYMIVPELHADGEHWHFHGLFSDIGTLPLKFSGKTCVHKMIFDFSSRPNGDKIYNIPRWKYGFSTATRIKSSVKAISYLGKYITKDLIGVTKGKRRFLSSHNLQKATQTTYNIAPSDIKKFLLDNDEFINYQKSITTDTGNKITYIELKKEVLQNESN